MQTGQDLFARTGSMVAYEGFVQYEPQPAGRPPDRPREWITGEGAPADEVLAATACSTSPTTAPTSSSSTSTATALSVNGTNLLAFDAHLSGASSGSRAWPSSPARACSTSRSPGTGWVALTSRGTPDRRRLRPRRGRDVRRPGRARRLVAEPQGEGQAQLQGVVADRPRQRRGLPDGLLRPGHRRRPAQRGQHRPPPGPGLRGRPDTSCRAHFSPTPSSRPRTATPCRTRSCCGVALERPRRRPRPQGRHGRLPGPDRVRRRVPDNRSQRSAARTPARAWT